MRHPTSPPWDARDEITELRILCSAATFLRRSVESLPASFDRDQALIHFGQASLHLARRLVELEKRRNRHDT